jgi:hypothetical protein
MSNISYSQAPGTRSAPIIPEPWSEADRLTRRLATSGLARLQEQFWAQERRLERLEACQGLSPLDMKGASERG